MGGGDENGGLTDPTESRVFDSVVLNVRKAYLEDRMQDASPNSRFICLLNLANECGLKIEMGSVPAWGGSVGGRG